MINVGKIPNNIMNYMLAVFMSFSFVYALTTSMFYKFIPVGIIILVALFTAVWSLILYNKMSLLISLYSLGFLLAVWAIFLLAWKKYPLLIRDFTKFITWLYDYLSGSVYLNSAYEFYINVLLSLCISLFIYIFTVKFFNFHIILVSGIALFAVQWMADYFVSYSSFYLFIFLISIYYFRNVYRNKAARESNDYAPPAVFTACVVPIVVLVYAISLLLPVSGKPIEWKWLDSRINNIITAFSNLGPSYFSTDKFSLASTGFGKSSILGGKVNLDKTLVLKIVANYSNFYLKGAVWDRYTGSRWVSSDDKIYPVELSDLETTYVSPDHSIGSSAFKMDFFETQKGMVLLTDERDLLSKYFKDNKIAVTFHNIKTKSLFYPSKTHKVDFGQTPFKLQTDSNGILSSDIRQGINFKYIMDQYIPKLSDEDFKELLRRSKKGLYEEFLSKAVQRDEASNYEHGERASILRVSNTDTNSNETGNRRKYKIIYGLNYSELELLADNAKKVYDKYLKLPETLPERVVELARSITASSKSSYDKAKAIEQYLGKNYPYSLTPKAPPPRRDFVDYFLFDLKEGYCSYYASAMTVLCRSIGIPARYVEGYMLPPSSDSGIYNVTNEQAHAWVEVYFEGFGWLPFEPTSPFSANFYASREYTGVISGGMVGMYGYEEYMRNLERYRNMGGDYELVDGVPIEEDEHPYTLIVSLSLIGLLLMVFVITVTFNYIRSKVMLVKLHRMHPRESVLFLYKYYLKLLSYQGLGMTDGETPLQYAERVSSAIHFKYATSKTLSFNTITNVFLVARYSDMDVSVKDKQTVFEFYERMLLKTQYSLGGLRFFLYRYILGCV